MKKMLFGLSISVLAGALALTGCTKPSTTLTTQQQIAGKWTMRSAIGHYIVMGDERRDSTFFTPSDYFEFNGDSTVTIHEGTTQTSGKWKIENNKLMISETGYMDNANGFNIGVLTSNDLELNYSEQSSSSTLEQKLSLRR